MLSLKIVYINSSLSLVNLHTLKRKASGLDCLRSAAFVRNNNALWLILLNGCHILHIYLIENRC